MKATSTPICWLIALATLTLTLITACSGTTLSISPELEATAQHLYDNPMPTPAFVIRTSQHDVLDSDLSECVDINQKPLWEAGFDANVATQELMDSAKFYIDEREIPRDELRTSITLLNYPVFDAETNIIGSYGPNMSFCADLTKFSNGLHLARIWFTTPSKTEHTYSWAFKK